MPRPARPLDDLSAPQSTEPDVAAAPAAEGLPDLAAPPVGTTFAEAQPAQKRHKKKYGIAFWMAVGWLGLVLFGAFAANLLPLKDPLQNNISIRVAAPLFWPGEQCETGPTGRPITAGRDCIIKTADHPLGTDGLGRDVLARLVFGSRVSLIVGFVTVAIGMTVGGMLGLIVGYFRGGLEKGVMASVDVVLAFPGLVLLLGLLAFVGQSLAVISITIGLLSVPRYTRVSRANTLAVAQREFVLAARAMGAKHSRIIFRELLPNVLLPVAAFALVAVAIVIVLEGSLAFLGLSVEQPTPTWGSMIAEGKRYLTRNAYVAAIPSLVMFLTVLSLNLVGDKMRSLFDVKESGL